MKDSAFFKALQKICRRNELITDSHLKNFYTFDAHLKGCLPEVVINITCTDELSSILRLCVQHGKAVVPRGNASGQTGGTVVTNPDTVLLNFSPLNTILSFNLINRTIDVQAGVTLQELNDYLLPYNLFFPPDPASKVVATIGGAIAENAGGLRASQFGVTKNYVLSLSGYTINGDFISFGSHTLKNVTGYNIKDLIIGSEGTLFIVTQATLRLLPLPNIMETLLVFFHNTHSFSAFLEFFHQHGYCASVMEIIDEPFLLELKKLKIPVKIPQNTVFTLLMEFDDYNPVSRNDIRALKTFLQTAGISFVQTRSEQKRELLWNFRRNLSQLLRTIGSYKFNEDVCVPTNHFIEFTRFCRELTNHHHLPIYLFGHLGDGNIHLNIIAQKMDDEVKQTVEKMRLLIFQKVVALQGSLSGEHGIGLSKKKYLPCALSESSIDIQKKVKDLFDPLGLLNPEKIF